MKELMKANPVRWCGLEPVYTALVAEGFAPYLLEAVLQLEPGIHGGDWPGFDVVVDRCRERALVASHDARFAGQPSEEWEAIEATVPPEERAAKERSLKR